MREHSDRVEKQAGETAGAATRLPAVFTAAGNADRTRGLAVLSQICLRCRVSGGDAGIR